MKIHIEIKDEAGYTGLHMTFEGQDEASPGEKLLAKLVSTTVKVVPMTLAKMTGQTAHAVEGPDSAGFDIQVEQMKKRLGLTGGDKKE